ncbi:MAG: TonB-dependent receptor [Sterolibacteriaceae bacterium]|nr:TonB-dependent receptor [Candidatus Methylophosphatis haderslevensis]
MTSRKNNPHPAVPATPLAICIAAAFGSLPAFAQTTLAPVVVTATRVEQSSFDLPVSIDSVDAAQLREQRLGANISESLNRVPGTVVQNRETYSQEQSLVIRGFGARSQFGVRGVKLIADGIPASTPDGQGGTGLFDLATAKRIEVLRGAFSALYGNHSGGVVQVFTEDGPAQPTLGLSLAAGSYGTRRETLKFGGDAGIVNYIGSISRLETDGYRQWSEATKDQANVKLRIRAGEKSTVTLIGNYLDQNNNQDPLGLTAAQVSADRRQAQPAALTFQTRRNLDNMQAGVVFDTALSDADSLRAIVYGGKRSNEQYLALAANGVSAFDRDFQGTGLRWTHRAGALTLTAGGDYERAQDLRQGFANNGGSKGALSRDEINTVYQAGAYAQAQWDVSKSLSLSGGLRYTRVSFSSEDHFINATNPNDSGKAKHSAWTPTVGAVFKLTPTINLYANAGRSFETPTFIELAYQPAPASGLNFALQPSRSNQYEIGVKAYVTNDIKVNVALFKIDTSNEIVINTNAGGRATYQNAGDTERRGIELAIDGPLGAGFNGTLAATWIDAKFRDGFSSCGGVTPPCNAASQIAVNSGNTIPGIPRYSIYGELAWAYQPLGFSSALEARWNGKAEVNDANRTVRADAPADPVAAYFVAGLRAGFEQKLGNLKLSEFVRVDNLFDKKYIGAIYVNDQNGRYYAPAPERNYLVGLSASYAF